MPNQLTQNSQVDSTGDRQFHPEPNPYGMYWLLHPIVMQEVIQVDSLKPCFVVLQTIGTVKMSLQPSR